VGLLSRVLLPAGAIEVSLTSLYLLTDHHSKKEEEVYWWDTFLKFFLHLKNMLCILPVLAWEYVVEWMVHYCFMFKKRSRKTGGVMPIMYSEFC
jgi:hypothetical protein